MPSLHLTHLPAAVVLGGLLVVPFAAVEGHAAPEAPKWTAVPVQNGDFALPPVAKDFEAKLPTDWSGSKTAVVSAALAGRSDKKQAVSLNDNTGQGILRTRLWNVNAGATVRVSFTDSSSTFAKCTPAEVANGQRYKVAVYKPVRRDPTGQPVKDPRVVHRTEEFQTAGYTKQQDAAGEGKWSEPRTFEFTAAEDNPLLTFESLTPNATTSNACGPMVAAVSAQERAAPVDYFVSPQDMPVNAYYVHDEVAVADAVAKCKVAAGCRFTIDPRYSYQYYGKVRVVDHAAINCSRNQKTDTRTLSYTEEGFDSVTTEVNRIANAASVDQRLDNSGANDKGSTSPNLQEMYPEMFKQAAAGFQRHEGNRNLVNTTNPLTPTRTTTKNVQQAVQPGEASWFEVQPSRERIEGTFSGSGYTLDVMLDYPSNRVPDRLFQRTGPMTQDEQRHCLTERPLRVTPDNKGVDAPSAVPPGTRTPAEDTKTTPKKSGDSAPQAPAQPRTRPAERERASSTTPAAPSTSAVL
ncbi:hypothetical protein ACFY7C_02095 [Streptomyces sp. NPDC012769]|uniref:hypothetical protein n=1 Tax=Streptomyces sp. NPDC012769 TaxID=3364848 RepID=UPI0036793B0C